MFQWHLFLFTRARQLASLVNISWIRWVFESLSPTGTVIIHLRLSLLSAFPSSLHLTEEKVPLFLFYGCSQAFPSQETCFASHFSLPLLIVNVLLSAGPSASPLGGLAQVSLLPWSSDVLLLRTNQCKEQRRVFGPKIRIINCIWLTWPFFLSKQLVISKLVASRLKLWQLFPKVSEIPGDELWGLERELESSGATIRGTREEGNRDFCMFSCSALTGRGGRGPGLGPQTHQELPGRPAVFSAVLEAGPLFQSEETESCNIWMWFFNQTHLFLDKWRKWSSSGKGSNALSLCYLLSY